MRTGMTQRVLQLSYDRFYADGGEWPTFGYLHRALSRQAGTDVDVARIVRQVSPKLLKPLRSTDGYPAPAEKLLLTVEGIKRCRGSEDDIANFVLAVRWLGRRAGRSDLSGEQDERGMRFTTRQLAEAVSLSLGSDRNSVNRLVSILQAEGWVLDDGGTRSKP